MLGPAETEYQGKSSKPRPTRTPLPQKNHLSHPQTNLPGVRVPGSRLSSHPQLTSNVSISPAALPEEPLPSIAVERRQRPPCGSLLPQPLLSKKPGLQGLWKTLFTERGRENCFSRSYQSQVFIGLSLNHGITKEARACTGERTIFLEAGQAAST